MPYFAYESNPRGVQPAVYRDLPWSSTNGKMKEVFELREITEEEAKLEISELVKKYPSRTV